jgi:hypothetical protein
MQVYGNEDETGTQTTLETPFDFVDGILQTLRAGDEQEE